MLSELRAGKYPADKQITAVNPIKGMVLFKADETGLNSKGLDFFKELIA